MNVLVTGGTGFLGRYLVPKLLACGHQVTVVGRHERKDLGWFHKVTFHVCDISHSVDGPFEAFGRPDAAIHLAWSGLPNYEKPFHIEENLSASQCFLTSLLRGGLRHLMVAGTCFEYGMHPGALAENLSVEPVNSYAIAKDMLRRSLESFRVLHPFTLQWARLFYVYGKGQNPRSLLSSLDQAIDSGASHFDMSAGEQIRDYLPVEDVAQRLAVLLAHPECDGIVNICSGTPVSILEVVKRHLAMRNATIQLNLGRYPYRDNEPMACWGDDSKFRRYCA